MPSKLAWQTYFHRPELQWSSGEYQWLPDRAFDGARPRRSEGACRLAERGHSQLRNHRWLVESNRLPEPEPPSMNRREMYAKTV